MHALLLSILLMPYQQSPAKDLEQYRDFDNCKKEMQKAWLEYTKYALRICGDCTDTRVEDGQSKVWRMQNVVGDGQCWKWSYANTDRSIARREFDGVTIVRNYQNYRQLIALERKRNRFKNEDFWVIAKVLGRNLEDEFGEAIPLDGDPKLKWKSYPACLPLRMTHKYAVPIGNFFEDSAFELIESSPSIVEKQMVVKISFRIKKGTVMSRFIGDGWIELLPKQYWVAHRAEYLMKNDTSDFNSPDRLWRIENQYDPVSSNVPVIRTSKEYTIDDKPSPNLPHFEESVQTTFQLTDKKLSEEDLSLIPYGLKELAENKPAEETQVEEQQNNGRKISYLKADANFLFLPYWVWIGFLLMLCLSSAILLRRRQLNAKTVKPSVR